jgi:hypothetical protein
MFSKRERRTVSALSAATAGPSSSLRIDERATLPA